jgi:hypothetical protein
MGAIVIRTRYDEGTESAEVATSDQRDSGLYERSNPKPSNIEKCDGPERQKSVMCDTNLSQNITYRTSVRLKGETENLFTTNDDFFTGVTKKRTARYYVSGIDPKSTRSGIITYLEQRDVHVTFLRLFNTKHNSYRTAAKLNVSESSASIVESPNFCLMVYHVGNELVIESGISASQRTTSSIVPMKVLTNKHTMKTNKQLYYISCVILTIAIMSSLTVLSWNVRGIMSSTVCLSNLVKATDCDICVISEHKTKMFTLY